jgi:hypothetical protein
MPSYRSDKIINDFRTKLSSDDLGRLQKMVHALEEELTQQFGAGSGAPGEAHDEPVSFVGGKSAGRTVRWAAAGASPGTRCRLAWTGSVFYELIVI